MSKKNEYLAFDGINRDHETFETIEEAQEYLKECFFDSDEGYHPDIDTCAIYKLNQKVTYDVIAKKSEFTDEKWSDEGYGSHFDEIWQHKFVNNS